MFNETIKAVIKRPGELGVIEVINNTNEEYKKLIGAEYLDYTTFKGDWLHNPIDLIVDDRGLEKTLEHNFELYGNKIVGTVIFVERDSEGEFVDLSEESLEYLKIANIL